MDNTTKQEIESIKSDLQSIVNDLRNVAQEIRLEFRGIGNHQCAQAVEKVAEKYDRIKRKL